MAMLSPFHPSQHAKTDRRNQPVGAAFHATVLILVGILLLSPLASAAAEALAHGDHALTFTSSFDETEQPYRVYVPSAVSEGRPLPLVVVLHGKGADQNAWFDYTPVKEMAEMRGYAVAAPFSRGNWFYRGPGEQDVLDILDEVARKVSINSDRVYVMGHSMGGWGAWWIGLRHPDRFVTICPLAGIAPVELLENARHLTPFVIHANNDVVVPVKNSRDPAGRMIDLGLSIQYREESGYGHSSKMIGDNFQRLFDWMDHRTLVKQPRRVTYATRTPLAGKAYWTWVFETASFPRLASIDADLDSSNTLHIATRNLHVFGVNMDDLPVAPGNALVIEIDGAHWFEAGENKGWAVFRAKADAPGWDMEFVSEDALPRYKSPVVARPSTAPEGEDRQAFVTRALGERIRRETGADVCLVSEDMFRLSDGPVTADAILDCFVWGDQGLYRMETSVHAIRKTLDGLDRIQKFIWGTPHIVGDVSRPYDTVVVAIPHRLARQFDLPVLELPETVPEYLMRSVRPGVEFP